MKGAWRWCRGRGRGGVCTCVLVRPEPVSRDLPSGHCWPGLVLGWATPGLVRTSGEKGAACHNTATHQPAHSRHTGEFFKQTDDFCEETGDFSDRRVILARLRPAAACRHVFRHPHRGVRPQRGPRHLRSLLREYISISTHIYSLYISIQYLLISTYLRI